MLFLSLTLTGILFPLTTALSLETIGNGKGLAAAILGFSQLMLSFLFSGAVGLFQNGTVWPIEAVRLSVAVVAMVLAVFGVKKIKKEF